MEVGFGPKPGADVCLSVCLCAFLILSLCSLQFGQAIDAWL